jgi:hypothetical protein
VHGWVLELFLIVLRSPWPTTVMVKPLQEMEFARDDPSRLKNNMWLMSQPTCRLCRLLFEIFGMGILHTCMVMFIVNPTGQIAHCCSWRTFTEELFRSHAFSCPL